MNNYLLKYCLLFLSFSIPFNALAVDSESNREAIVTARSKKFYKSDKVRQYLSFGGSYSSDYNSKKREFNSRYLYQSHDFIHEVDYENESEYADSGSGDNRNSIKKTELYDISLSSKARISDSQNYAILFHRTKYDDLSKYYYDLHSAVGIGRMFFKETFHLDLSVGYHDVKSYGHSINVIPSLRTRFNLTKNIRFTQKGYWFLDHESMDSGLKTSISYRLNKKVSLELRHNFEQRRYEDKKNNDATNLVNRRITIGLTFSLN